MGNPAPQNLCQYYNDAIASRRRAAPGKLFTLIAGLRVARLKFLSLSNSTKRAYSAYLRMIETEFGDMPIEALSDPEVQVNLNGGEMA